MTLPFACDINADLACIVGPCYLNGRLIDWFMFRKFAEKVKSEVLAWGVRHRLPLVFSAGVLLGSFDIVVGGFVLLTYLSWEWLEA